MTQHPLGPTDTAHAGLWQPTRRIRWLSGQVETLAGDHSPLDPHDRLWRCVGTGLAEWFRHDEPPKPPVPVHQQERWINREVDA